MAVMPKYYKIHTDGCDVALEPIYTELVPVVRCKYCVHGTLCHNLQGAEYVDCCYDDYTVRKPDDFCSYGERKDT